MGQKGGSRRLRIVPERLRIDSKRELIPKGYSHQGHRKRHTHPWSGDGELVHSKPVLSPNNSLGGELWCDIVLISENHTLDILAQE